MYKSIDTHTHTCIHFRITFGSWRLYQVNAGIAVLQVILLSDKESMNLYH